MGGRYYTATDVGTTSDDLDVVGRTSRYVVGRNRAAGGSGDSGYSTAFGVFSSLRAAAAVAWGGNGLAGKVVGLRGVSDNARGWWDLDAGRAVGFEPTDDASTFAAAIDGEPSEPQGGMYASAQFTLSHSGTSSVRDRILTSEADPRACVS